MTTNWIQEEYATVFCTLDNLTSAVATLQEDISHLIFHLATPPLTQNLHPIDLINPRPQGLLAWPPLPTKQADLLSLLW